MEKPPKECPTCQKQFSGPWATGDLNKHMTTHLPKPEKIKEKFTCPKCKEDFPFRSILEIHKNRKKPCVPVYWSTLVIPTHVPEAKYTYRLLKYFYDEVVKVNPDLPYTKHANRPRWTIKLSKDETKEVGLDDFTEMWLNLFFDYFPDEHPQFYELDAWLSEKEQTNYLHANKKDIIDPVAYEKNKTKYRFSRFCLQKIPDDEKDMYAGDYFSSIWTETQEWLVPDLYA